MNKLNRVKAILGIEDESVDEILTLLLKKSEMWVRSACGIFDSDKNLELIPLCEPLQTVVADICVIRYNKIGSEGLRKESVGPLSMDYEDLPGEIRDIAGRYRRLQF
ncbi:MAG: Phage gp6-like head-tail connector protein [Firmicutes bacterium ADurb.Bin193]|nr:MAG: Phage gp6-like head-tail connector protein [Firmicutes bacterium ADurb.Bin193]